MWNKGVRTWSERTLLFSLFTELESILCLNVSHNTQMRSQMFHWSGAAWQPRCVVGQGQENRAPRQKPVSLHFTLSRKIVLLCFKQNTFKMTSWKMKTNLSLGDPQQGNAFFDTSVGKWVSRIFWISSKLAVKANTIVLDGLLLFRMSLGTVQ